MHRPIICFAAPLLLISLTVECRASNVPPALYNKTISLSWTIQMTVKTLDGGTKAYNAPRQRTIYISDKGRLFVRERRLDGSGKMLNVEEREPGNNTNFTGNASSLRFDRNQLVAITGQIDGANITRVSFSPDFSSCSMTWGAGKSRTGRVTWKGSDGNTYELVSATSSGGSCNIQAGNGLAN